MWQSFLDLIFGRKKPVEKKPVETAPPKVEQPTETTSLNPPWYDAAKKQSGKKETDSKFAAIMVPLWKKLFGRSIGTIATGTAAWCGLAMAAALFWGGQDWQQGGEAARNWGKYGVAVEWQKQGAPKGAIVWINHGLDCSSSKGNHVTQMNGDCTAEDMRKLNATFDGFGGNQQNTWKVTTYAVNKICAVRWPKNYPFPKKVIKSVNCSGKSASNESTR